MTDTDQAPDIWHRTKAMVSEGLCPSCHGDLTVRPLRPGGHDDTHAGWCGTCQRGFSVRTHHHDEDCAGPNLDEADLFCIYLEGELALTWWYPNAFHGDPLT